MRWLHAGCTAMLVSCGSHAPVAPRPVVASASAIAASTAPPPLVDVTITEDPSADRWLVAYHFARPSMGVRFDRGHDPFRAKAWGAIADGGKSAVAWQTIDGVEAVVSSNEPFSELVLSFPTDDSKKQSGYWLNATFSDGGRLLYTGHFAVTLLPCGTGAAGVLQMSQRAVASTTHALDASAPKSCEPTRIGASDMRFTFRTAKARHISVLDSRGTGELTWTPTFDPVEGTYVYFGDVEPRDTPFGHAIIDPALPAWMLADANAYMPRMLDWFAQDMGAPLTAKPHVFVSFGAGRSFGLKGGGLTRVVQLAVWGDAWSKSDDASHMQWLEFLAHELFHIWNGDVFRATAPWLSEGSSDLFAWRALLDLGVIDRTRFHHEVVAAANKCMMTIGRRPLLDVRYGGPGYSCGATLLAWADAIGRDHRKTVGDILGSVFAHAPSHHRFGTDDFMRELAALEPDRKRIEPFERVLHQGVPEHIDELFQTALARPDFAVTLAPVSAADVEQHAAYRQVATELAHCDCDRRVNVSVHDTGLDFGESPECSVLKGVHVVSVDGHVLPKDALAAYRAILERPKDEFVLSIDGRKDPLKLTCRKDADLPPFKKLLH